MKSTCPLGITQKTIVAWRDHALDSAAAARLSEHMQSCSACAGYRDVLTANARLLHAQPLPPAMGTLRRQDRLWRDVRGHIVHEKERKASMHNTRSTLLRGAAMVIGVIVVITLGFGAIQLLSRRAQLAAHTTPAVLHVSTANGSTISLPAAFWQTYISPDGNTIIGTHQVREHDPSGNSSAMLTRSDMIERYDVATDGRYVAWTLSPPFTSSGSAATVTPSQLQLMTLDLQTMHIHTLAQKTVQGENVNGDYTCTLDHGTVFWQDMYGGGTSVATGGMLKMTDLASGATKTLSSTLTLAAISHSEGAFQSSWPYVVIATGLTREQLFNVATGTNVTLPPLPQSANADPSFGPQYQLDGATVLASWHTITNGIAFAEINTASPNASWQTIATLTTPYIFYDDYFQVNSRLLVFSGYTTLPPNNVVTPTVPLAWDRHLHRLLQFSAPAPPQELVASLYGKWLVLFTYNLNEIAFVAQTMTLTLLDTAQVLVK